MSNELSKWLPERIDPSELPDKALMDIISIDKSLQKNAPEGCVVVGINDLIGLVRFAHAAMTKETGQSTNPSKEYIEERTDPANKNRQLTPRERTVGRSYNYWSMSIEKQIVEDIRLGYLNVDLRDNKPPHREG